MEHKKLSIVIATYNGASFLREQLDSLFAQTLQADEIIAVDDCSTDGTVPILEEYRQKYGLIYVVNEHNLRVNKNFEKGIQMSTGDYVSLCDQDDVWFKEKNEMLYNKLKELEVKYPNTPCLVSSRNTFVDEKLRVHHSTELKHDTDDYRDTVLYHLSQGSSMMFNRACIKEFLPLPVHEAGVCYDSHIGYIVAMIGHKYDLRQSLMYYRVHGNNVTASLRGVSNNKRDLRRFRSPSVVPEHMIRTFQHASAFVKEKAMSEKIQFVNRIIELSQNMGLAKRLWLLCITPKIPFGARWYSIKACVVNRIINAVLIKKIFLW